MENDKYLEGYFIKKKTLKGCDILERLEESEGMDKDSPLYNLIEKVVNADITDNEYFDIKMDSLTTLSVFIYPFYGNKERYIRIGLSGEISCISFSVTEAINKETSLGYLTIDENNKMKFHPYGYDEYDCFTYSLRSLMFKSSLIIKRLNDLFDNFDINEYFNSKNFLFIDIAEVDDYEYSNRLRRSFDNFIEYQKPIILSA